eukprot:CAMPEP_0176022096 /NCGR_PEP_ID=MMETSP0120_2-20121206/10747_1 /TAXON_ID=160619 /ORGANISM="Kryptoperidinium foliaceum, Strain CCMP 1326" /LENGTH=57 /DNA_ID=CAMNT_0017355227 /DNA_START=11 /DNA_END=181 /DNA_ORIENTATION=+
MKEMKKAIIQETEESAVIKNKKSSIIESSKRTRKRKNDATQPEHSGNERKRVQIANR